MWPSWPLLLAAALLSLSSVRAVQQFCLPPDSLPDYPAEQAEEPPYVDPRLPWTRRFKVDACAYTFRDYEASHIKWGACYHNPSHNHMACPRDCTRAVGLSAAAVVYGSFPYHANSSICLAAIHAGVISNRDGGGLFLSRFYPIDWSNSSSQTLYPHGAAHGSLSNGVQSLDVSEHDSRTPAPVSSYSFIVRGREQLLRQPQTAPFSPRAGHLHAWLYPDVQKATGWQQAPPYGFTQFWLSSMEPTLNYSAHLVIGGHNATHYLNDVWLFHSHTLGGERWNETVADRQNSRNGQWYRLPDAPFSGRAYAQHHLVLDPQPPLQAAFDASVRYTADRIVLLVVGGELGYSCGNRLLARCSDEVWQLSIRRVGAAGTPGDAVTISPLGLSFAWDVAASGNRSEPASRLPFASRCDWAPVFERRLTFPRASRVTAIAGGQLSYADSLRCTAPVETVNEVWYGVWPYREQRDQWALGRPAPFSRDAAWRWTTRWSVRMRGIFPSTCRWWSTSTSRHRWQAASATSAIG